MVSRSPSMPTPTPARSLVYRGTINGGRIVARDVYLSRHAAAAQPDPGAHGRGPRRDRAARPRRRAASDVFNVFVVPPLTPDGAIDVYQVSPQTRPGFYPLGGHFRTSVAPDGGVVASAAIPTPVSTRP